MAISDTLVKMALDSGAWTAKRDGQAIGFDDLTVGPNSINLSLSAQILEIQPFADSPIDLHDADSFCAIEHDCGKGFVLQPGRLYLGAVRESFDCAAALWVRQDFRFDLKHQQHFDEEEIEKFFYPVVDGRSTAARVGLSVHQTSGRGDFNFSGALEMANLSLLARPSHSN